MPSRKRVSQSPIPAALPAVAKSNWRSVAHGCLLFGLVLVVYLPSLSSGFIWDDDDYVTENGTLRSLGGLRQIWLEPAATPQYYPVVFTTFWIDPESGEDDGVVLRRCRGLEPNLPQSTERTQRAVF